MQGSFLNGIYRIELQLGKRGSRATYLAKDTNTNKYVVVKILKFGFDAEWSDFRLFEREAQTLKNINHPAIPKYLDYFELDLPECKGFALVQEYLAAPSLEETIKAGRTFNEVEIKAIAETLLNILSYLHQQQPSIIHRDIKPSNILLTNRSGNSVGQVYLIDFGAVKSVASSESSEGGTITVVGTYGYMPPEQFGGYTTPASDLYSLGATLIYLATGRHPTELPSKDGKITFAESVQLSSSLVRWLEQIVEPNLEKRFQSAIQALQALQQPIIFTKSEIVRQPAYSKIRLRKTTEKIDVSIPPKNLVPELFFSIISTLVFNGFLAVWTGVSVFMIPLPINIFFALFSIPFWIVGLGLAGAVLFTAFGSTKLKITDEQISLTYECLGLKYQRPKPRSRQDIEAIESTVARWHTGADGEKTKIPPTVIIWADGKAYTLTTSVKQQSNLSNKITNYNPANIELNWLAQELSEWLGIPITKSKDKH